jgi:hypothetical protein
MKNTMFIVLASSVLISGCASTQSKTNNVITQKAEAANEGVEKTTLSCTGDLWDFGIGKVSNSQTSYWENVIIYKDYLIVPKFGQYQKRGEREGKIFWDMKDGVKKNWAMLDKNTNEFTASIKKGGNKQMQGKCSKKSNVLF